MPVNNDFTLANISIRTINVVWVVHFTIICKYKVACYVYFLSKQNIQVGFVKNVTLLNFLPYFLQSIAIVDCAIKTRERSERSFKYFPIFPLSSVELLFFFYWRVLQRNIIDCGIKSSRKSTRLLKYLTIFPLSTIKLFFF